MILKHCHRNGTHSYDHMQKLTVTSGRSAESAAPNLFVQLAHVTARIGEPCMHRMAEPRLLDRKVNPNGSSKLMRQPLVQQIQRSTYS